MNPNPTLTVGIPAFNEEANIGGLLRSLLDQAEINFRLEKIIVASDGSTDNTLDVVLGFHHDRIVAIASKDRKGPAYRNKQIASIIKSDIYVHLDADIYIEDHLFLARLVDPIVKGQADLTSGTLREWPSETRFEEILRVGSDFKRAVFASYRQGNNIYTCHGPARACSRRVYKELDPGTCVADDAYVYLFCQKRQYPYQFVPDAVVLYRSPRDYWGHRRQSLRFVTSKEHLNAEFGADRVAAAFAYPKSLALREFLKIAMRHPLQMLAYAAIVASTRINSIFVGQLQKGAFDQVSSTKSLRKMA